MTLIAWIIFKIKKTEDGKPTSIGMWLAIILAAVIFGIGIYHTAMAITTLNASNGYQSDTLKCCWWNYIRMALLEKGFRIRHDITFFCRYSAACDFTTHSSDLKPKLSIHFSFFFIFNL
jgi:hypothetical protein